MRKILFLLLIIHLISCEYPSSRLPVTLEDVLNQSVWVGRNIDYIAVYFGSGKITVALGSTETQALDELKNAVESYYVITNLNENILFANVDVRGYGRTRLEFHYSTYESEIIIYASTTSKDVKYQAKLRKQIP